MTRTGGTTRFALGAVGGLLAAWVVSALAAGDAPGEPRKPAVEKPHWTDTGCKHCHEIKNGEVATVAADAEALCLSCHNHKRALVCAHPAGVPPTHAKIAEPAKWPLQNGRLACLTCHDAKLACKKPAFRPAGNAAFLRNVRPYAPADWFCANCHPTEQYPKLNPHIMLDAKDKIVPRRCLICHTDVPDDKTLLRSSQPRLRADKTDLCLGCHKRHSDINPKGHMGQPITRETSAYIAKRDVGVLYEYLKRTATSQPDAPDFPRALDAKGRITCVTCHNPHQQATFPAESILAYGGLRVVPGKSNKVSPTVAREEGCRDCHNMANLTTRRPLTRPATAPERP